jgi:hypothetical protein
MSSALYGLVAEFADPQELVAAASAAANAGYTHMDAYTPFPVEGLAEALRKHHSWIPLIFLLGGLIGGCGGYFMEYYAAVLSYPINVGGRPLHSWPAFIPVTFELTVLISALSGFVGVLVSMGLPRLNHPIFNTPGFKAVTEDKFFLCLEACDPQFRLSSAQQFLESLKPLRIVEVPA